jgi:hypothetical protein
MHSPTTRLPIALLAAIAAAVLPFSAPLAARADDDAAGVGVARINFIAGSVAVQRGDTATPLDAAINAPVLGADYVTTAGASRAEIQFDGLAAVRLAENAQIRFTHLDAADRELQLAQGTIELRLLRGTDGRSVIDTPSVSIRPLAAGAYRVTVDADGRTRLDVRSGRAEVALPQGAQTIAAGGALLAQGPAASPSVELAAAAGPDPFDTFNAERDQRESLALAGAAYLNPNVQGADDLYAYGRWVSDPGYGTVWVPTAVASGWAPYREGRWVWEDGFGWTWVGYEPWGWAPYHYGRWYHSPAYGWAWYPPRPAVVEVWRPALVAFIGFGGGGGVSLGFGNIGWVPLAPFEPYRPWWGRGYGTTVVNTTYVTNNYYGNVNNGQITRIYKNAQYNGVTSVSQQRFLEGRFDHHVAVTPAQLRSVQVARGPLPVVPTQANLRFDERSAGMLTATHPALVQRAFAGRGEVVTRTPFEQQRTALATAAHVAVPPEREHATTHPAGDPWVRFNPAPNAAKAHPATTTTTTTTNGTGAVTVTNGTGAATVTHPAPAVTGAWTRFDKAAEPRARTAHAVGTGAATGGTAGAGTVQRGAVAPVRHGTPAPRAAAVRRAEHAAKPPHPKAHHDKP